MTQVFLAEPRFPGDCGLADDKKQQDLRPRPWWASDLCQRSQLTSQMVTDERLVIENVYMVCFSRGIYTVMLT